MEGDAAFAELADVEEGGDDVAALAVVDQDFPLFYLGVWEGGGWGDGGLVC